MKDSSKKLSASHENYIKAIFEIVSEKTAARVKDISKNLNIGASSVSEALKTLSEKGIINYEPYGIVTLTEEGLSIAQDLKSRHEIIKYFFENVLVVDASLADDSARKVEYAISEDVLKKLVMFIEFMQTCSCKEPKWMKSFKYYSQNDELQTKCQKCVELSKENPELKCNGSCCGLAKG